ncbi:MAG: phage tail protein [Propylenella sp.]
MTQVFIGQISMFGGNFAPKNFAFCNGQLLQIAQNTALFSLIGTYYGGDGRTTFALPNLQSRLPVHYGNGAGLSNYNIGQAGGAPTATIDTTTMPAHNHTLEATQAVATTNTIATNVLPGQPTVGSPPAFYAVQQSGQPPPTPQILNAAACSNVGGNQPHTNLMPSLCITFIIALTGIFPSRN